jgi:hypothetical protein
MTEAMPKTDNQTTVRIYEGTKKRLQKVVRKLANEENRTVTEIEIAEEIFKAGLSKRERKLGI